MHREFPSLHGGRPFSKNFARVVGVEIFGWPYVRANTNLENFIGPYA
jgi:hypothetical protein